MLVSCWGFEACASSRWRPTLGEGTERVDYVYTSSGAHAIMVDIRWVGRVIMTSLLVRGLDESVKERLAKQAKEHGRSMEAEAREILARGVARPNIGVALMNAVQEVGGVDDLPIPPRDDVARAADVE